MPFRYREFEPENVKGRANESKSSKLGALGAYKEKESGEVSFNKASF